MNTAVKRPTLCVVAGPNGSGKTTTTTQLLCRTFEGKIVKQYADILPEWVARII